MKTDSDSSHTDIVINRFYNKKELCFLFGNLSLYFLNRMLEDVEGIGQPLGVGYSPAQIMLIIQRYDMAATFIRNQMLLK